MIAYWSKLLTEKETALFKLFLAIQLNQDIGKIYCFDCIKTTLNHFGLSNIWLELNIQNTKWLKVKSKKKTCSNWSILPKLAINTSKIAKAVHYRLYKEELKFENYLDTLTKKMQSYFVDFEHVITTYLFKVDVAVILLQIIKYVKNA